jgi:hypothetical protein
MDDWEGLDEACSLPPIVGSLFSWKSLFTNRRTNEDYSVTGQQIGSYDVEAAVSHGD